MSYAVKKAGVAFIPKVNVNPDLTGKAANFAMFYYADTDPATKTDVVGSFTESTDAPGLYFAPAVTVPVAGDYTFNIVNDTDSLGNISTPVVITNASLDDVSTAVADLRTVADTIAVDVDGLDGQNLQDIKDSIAAISTLVKETSNVVVRVSGDETAVLSVGETITGDTSAATGTVELVEYDSDQDETRISVKAVDGIFVSGETVSDGTTSTTGTINTIVVNAISSVIDFISDLESAISSGSGLSALEGYTDDIENMLVGTEFLADGTTANPFYDATNPGVAKESTLAANLAQLQTDITTAQTNVTNHVDGLIGASTDDALAETLFGKIAAAKAVVDGNELHLEDAGYGLAALKALIDTMQIGVTDANTDTDTIIAELANAEYGLDAIENKLVTMDGKLDSIETKIDNIGGSSSAVAFI